MCFKILRNTKKIAEAITAVLDAQVIEVKEAKTESLLEYDLIGFGSGIYFANHDPDLLELIDDLPKVDDRKSFIFQPEAETVSLRTLTTKRLKKN